jgi:phosphoglycolate phosphatase
LLTRAFAARGRVVDEADHAAFLEFYTVHGTDETKPYPGMVEALAALRAAGHKLGVCTNKPEVAAREILAGLGLDVYFKVVTGGDSTPYRKPDGRHLAATLAALGAQQAVMVGDHHNDIAAATGCGIPAIFAAWGYGHARGDFTAQSASEIPGIVALMEG